jgi:hypothetical protein
MRKTYNPTFIIIIIVIIVIIIIIIIIIIIWTANGVSPGGSGTIQ